MALPAILQQLGKNSMAQAAQPVRQLMSMVKAAKDPQAALSQLAMNNPQLKQVMDIVQKHGGDPMTAFRNTAAEMGVDPDEIMNMLK